MAEYRLQSKPSLRKLMEQALELALAGELQAITKTDHPLYDYTELYYLIGEPCARVYMRVMNDLRLELVPQRADDQEVISALTDLFKQVVSNPTAFQGKGKLKKRLDEFDEIWDRPLMAYQVAYSIDYLDSGSSVIRIGTVNFLTPDDSILSEWGLDEVIKRSWLSGPEVGARSLAYMQIEAAEGRFAYETGKPFVLDAINVLKTGALRGLGGSPDPDDMLQWRLNGHWAIKPVNGSVGVTWGWRRPFKPLVTDLSKRIEGGLAALDLAELFNEQTPPDIRKRLLRAVYWISHSVAHESPDHKAVDLCTALEVMLLPDYTEGGKGERIALRYNLLGGNLNPAAIKGFYDCRSAVVHGAAVGIVGVSDIWHLRLECNQVLGMLIRASARDRETQTLAHLISGKETVESLNEFIDRCRKGIYYGTGTSSLRKYAHRLVRQIAPSDNSGGES